MSRRGEVEHAVLRRLARDQWVRVHGTPRITVLVGGGFAKRLWTEWLSVSGMQGTLHEGSDVNAMVRTAIGHAIQAPQEPVGILVTKTALGSWRSNRSDRSAALIDEGLLEVPAPRGATGKKVLATNLDARSVAEATLYEALQSTQETAGRFELNESLAVRFGSRAAEVDLLSRRDSVAIEIDGIHHFADPECYRRDRRKDLLLQNHGLLVIRLLAEDVLRDPRAAVTIVCQALAGRTLAKERVG